MLLDVMMPVLDGYAVCARLRGLPRGQHVPVLMMTGLEDVASINRAYEVGATDFITKPINYTLLSYRVRYMLRANEISDELRISKERLLNAQRIAKLGHWEWDFQNHQLIRSDQVNKILGIPEDAPFRGAQAIVKYVHPEDRADVAQAFRRALEDRESYSIEHRIIRPDHSIRIIQHQAEIDSNSDGLYRLIGTIQDITERKRTEQQIENLAFYDRVTGLLNRITLRRELMKAITTASRFKRTLAVMMLDVDHFKRINDSLGHGVGDLLLRQIGARMAGCIRGSDLMHHGRTIDSDSDLRGTVACVGGDQFGILLNEIRSAEDAAIVARRIQESFQEPFEVEGHELFITMSIGISAYPLDGADGETLLKYAHAAMNHAKADGRDRYQFYTASINTRAFERLSVEANLRHALDEDQLLLHFQPKVRLSDNRVVGLEALLRWRHPTLGLVSPADFIPVAEETGLIVPIGYWIMRTVCESVNAWHAAGYPTIPVAVNLSAAQFKQRDLCQKIRSIIETENFDPAWLELELTESLLMDGVDKSVSMLQDLKEIGLELTIDDFGTGYSSLSYLKQFPISTLKIDQSFIRDVNNDANDAAIVGAVIAMAHSLGLKVVAEGIEYVDQLRFLEERGCDVVQGYYYTCPLASAELIEWLIARQHAGPSGRAAESQASEIY
jgi:diguanylate cyclase (GGDEF)-like protein/PAS domain S-box-containing protein